MTRHIANAIVSDILGTSLLKKHIMVKINIILEHNWNKYTELAQIMQNKLWQDTIYGSKYKVNLVPVVIVDSLPETKDGNKYILIVYDYLTKWHKHLQLNSWN